MKQFMGVLSIRWQLVNRISHNLLNIDAMMSNDTSMDSPE